MSKALVVVESPAKAKTINKYLGPEYIVEASLGHVRDLPKDDIAVDVEGGFVPTYVPIDRRKDVLARLRQLSRNCDAIYLATDPDREGEAIAWHVAQEIADDSVPQYRVLFSEITRSGVKKAMTAPRKLDMDLVRAQEARRVMDRLIGYKISPFLWRAFRGEGHSGLSAGRVQSVGLRLVVEREREINSFIPIEYWNLFGTFRTEKGDEFAARLVEYDGITLRNPFGSAADGQGKKKVEETRTFIATKEEAEAIRDRALFEEYEIIKVEKKEVKRKAPAPFTTSTLQQDAGRRLRMKPKAVMSAAQKLYEGVEIGTKGRVGLITYMRTDSVRVSDEAAGAAEEWIYENFGKEYLPPKRKEHQQKKGAVVQDAHEAIRPADLKITPRTARKHLDEELANLYELIYRRFIASQMADALFDQTTVDVRGGSFLFRATGRVEKFRGWMQVYDDQEERKETKTDKGEEEDDESKRLPEGLRKGARAELQTLTVKRSETKPPPRYNESTLVKEMEAKGIGRPSTYAQTIATLLERNYIFEQARRLHATDLGIKVCDALTANFPTLFDVKFTARMEKDLDTIADGKATYLAVMQGFYKPFTAALKTARIEPGESDPKELKRREVRKVSAREAKRIDRKEKGKPAAPAVSSSASMTCDKCGSAMELREGKYGPYYACLGFPRCSNLVPASEAKEGGGAKSGSGTNGSGGRGRKSVASKGGAKGGTKGKGKSVPADEAAGLCDKCGAPMMRRTGRNGDFYGCSAYPDCRNTRPIPLDINCPQCKAGHVVERVGGRYNSTFYGCSRYPDCRFTSSKKPLKGTCEKCGNPWLVEGYREGEGTRTECPKCG